MARSRARQRPLPFVASDLSQRLSADVRAGTIELLTRMLMEVVLGERQPQEKEHEREDPADPS